MDSKDIQSQVFAGPVPGQSLTDEPGAFPWEQPPMYNEVDDVRNYYTKKIADEEVSDNLLDMMDLGIPISVISGSMLSKGIMDGIHTVDVKLILQPQIGVLLKNMAEEAGISYKETMNDYIDENPAKERKNRMKLAAKLAIRQSQRGKDEGDMIQEVVAEEIVEEPQEQEEPKGLMAKE